MYVAIGVVSILALASLMLALLADGQAWSSSALALASDQLSSDEDDPGAHKGNIYNVSFRREGRNLGYFATTSGVSPDFRNDSGFVRRTDIREYFGNVNYRWYPETWVVNWGPRGSYNRNYNYAGVLQDEERSVGVGFQLVLHLPGTADGGVLRQLENPQLAVVLRGGLGVDRHERRQVLPAPRDEGGGQREAGVLLVREAQGLPVRRLRDLGETVEHVVNQYRRELASRTSRGGWIGELSDTERERFRAATGCGAGHRRRGAHPGAACDQSRPRPGHGLSRLWLAALAHG